MTTQWHCINCNKVYKTYQPTIANYIAGVADGQGLRNSEAGNGCWNCSAGSACIVADN